MPLKSKRDALDFVERHGVVLESARGAVPSLAHAIAGERIPGSWWGHPKGNLIYVLLNDVRESGDVLTCRLIDGRVTLVHRRLWPALVRIARRFDAARLAAISEEHTASGAHRVTTQIFLNWVPADIRAAAKQLSEDEATKQLAPLLASAKVVRKNYRAGARR
jgi:hypothetical protein